MRRLAAMLAFAALTLAGCAARTERPAPLSAAPLEPPRLIVAVAVDQLSADLFAEYRQNFTGGLAKLLDGAVFPSGYQAHAATETCPGHATLLTGTRPARSGIIANYWSDPDSPRKDKRIYCAEDVTDPASSAANPVVSARFLKVPTLGELMKSADPATLNVAVSAKDRAVMMMGGHAIDAGYWWKGSGFASFKGVALSPAVLAQNAAVAAAVKKGAPGLPVPAWCGARDRAVAVGKGSVGTGRFVAPAGNLAAWRGSPRIDLATVDLALALVAEQGLGADAVPDVLSVSLSATDFIGHGYGTGGMEMCLQMATLDRALGRLFAGLDARGIDYAVVLSADHGGLDTIERLDHQALPRADRSADDLSVEAFEQEIRKRTGITLAEPLLYADGINGDYYVSHALAPAQRTRVAEALLTVARGHRQVAAAFSQADLARTPLPSGNPQDWSLKDRARASFDAERSGDVVVLLDRAIAPIPQPAIGTYIATHGSVWDYDRRVPILFWRRGLAGFEQPAPVETIDIAPTLAAILGLKLPDGAFDGRCLDIDGGTGNSCEGVR